MIKIEEINEGFSDLDCLEYTTENTFNIIRDEDRFVSFVNDLKVDTDETGSTSREPVNRIKAIENIVKEISNECNLLDNVLNELNEVI